MTNEELIARLRDGCNLQQKDGERAADRIEALSISNATLIAERDEALEWLSASQGYIADAVYALDKQEAAEAKLAENEVRLRKAVEALGEISEYDTGATAGLAYTAKHHLAEIKGEIHE